MIELTTELLARACRHFMTRAYPAGAATIPERKRPYFEIPGDAAVSAYLPPAPCSAGLCEVQKTGDGYAFRLGSAHFPHIKLRVQGIEHRGTPLLVWSVDTHDALPQLFLAIEPAEKERWQALQAQNAQLKHQIEEDLQAAGFLTPLSLLRLDLPASPSS